MHDHVSGVLRSCGRVAFTLVTVVVFTFVLTYPAEEQQIVMFTRNTTGPIVGTAVPSPAQPPHGLVYFARQYIHLLAGGNVIWIVGIVAVVTWACAAKGSSDTGRTGLGTDDRADVGLQRTPF